MDEFIHKMGTDTSMDGTLDRMEQSRTTGFIWLISGCNDVVRTFMNVKCREAVLLYKKRTFCVFYSFYEVYKKMTPKL